MVYSHCTDTGQGMIPDWNWDQCVLIYLPPVNEVCEGYVFTPVCQSFCSPPAGTPHWQVHPLAGTPPWPQCMLGYSQQAGGTHPTGMHSCMQKCSHWYKIGTGIMNHCFYLCQSGSRPSGPVPCSVNKP